MNILLTGGAGFIGSHTAVELIESGHNPILLDTFRNSSEDVIGKLEQITGKPVKNYDVDIRNTQEVTQILKDENIELVMHFAALKAVGESSDIPLDYYQTNITGLLSLLESMSEANVNQIIFSSSCTVYGDPEVLPLTEDSPLGESTNPYGETKKMSERILADVANATDLKVSFLRYFNPIGAHPSSLIGELPIGPPNCLVPYVAQTAAGIRESLTVHGNDYDTPDGSGIRDYIHVVDLARAHTKTIDYLASQTEKVSAFNIGSGKGYSVIEVVEMFKKVNSIEVPYTIGPRRTGDIAETYASAEKAERLLGWKTEFTMEDALRDTWNWQKTLS